MFDLTTKETVLTVGGAAVLCICIIRVLMLLELPTLTQVLGF